LADNSILTISILTVLKEFQVSGDQNSLRSLRILVAEDESLIALDLTSMLDGFECEVIGPLSRVDEVLRRLMEADDIDGALLDVNLRGRQIFEVLPDILARGIKVVLTSGYDDTSHFPEAFRDLPRVAKPFDERALRDICQRVFAR
jgi:DNA-binding NtrC family response regulator